MNKNLGSYYPAWILAEVNAEHETQEAITAA